MGQASRTRLNYGEIRCENESLETEICVLKGMIDGIEVEVQKKGLWGVLFPVPGNNASKTSSYGRSFCLVFVLRFVFAIQ